MRTALSQLITALAPSALALLIGAAHGRQMTIPLHITAGEHCRFDARTAELLDAMPVVRAERAALIEAEAPARYFCDPEIRRLSEPLPADPAASGGRFIDAVSYACYPFTVAEAGSCTVWVRVSSPPGRFRFRDLIDGIVFTGTFAEDNQEPRAWHWVKRGTVQLQEGAHRYEVVNFGYDFPALDAIVLVSDPDWTPDAGAAPVAETVVPQRGWVETEDLELPGARRLLSVEGQGTHGVSVQVSLDQGGQWHAFEPGDGLDCEGKPLRFRFELTAGGALRQVAARFDVAEDALIDVSHAGTRLVLDRRTGGLLLIENLTTGQMVVSQPRPRPLFDLEFKISGEARWTRTAPDAVQLIQAQTDQGGRWVRKPDGEPVAREHVPTITLQDNRVTMVYSIVEEGLGSARVAIALEPAEDETWRFAVTGTCLEGPADVTSIAFPVLERVRIGPSGLDDHQVRMQSFGHHALQPGKQPVRDDRYMGSTVMPWTEVYDDRGGIYVGSHDPTATNLLFESRASGPVGETVSLVTRKMEDLHPGESITYEYRLAAHQGAWHWGAERYRAWFYRTYGKATYPDWLRHTDGWVGLQAENYGREFRFDQLGDWLTQARSVGLDWVQVWGQFAYDGGPCCSNFYALSPLYGGRQAWADACQHIRKRRGHIGAYFLYHGLDLMPVMTDYFLGHFPKTRYPDDTAWVTGEFFHRLRLVTDPANVVPPFPPYAGEVKEKLDAMGEHQNRYAEGERSRAVNWWHGTYINDADWRNYLKEWIVDRYQMEYANDAVYIDVLGTGRTSESFDPRRGHNGDGGYSRGRLLLAKTIAEAALANNPDYGLTMEGMGDLPGRYFASMCSGVYWGGRHIMRYTFPERIFIHGSANAGSGGGLLDRFLTTFLEGMRYDHQGPYRAGAVNLLKLQRQITPWLYHTTFRDSLGLHLSSPRVKARLHLADDGPVRGAFITVINPERQPGVTLTLDPVAVPVSGGVFYRSLNGDAGQLHAKTDPDGVTVTLPTDLACVLLLPARQDLVVPVWYLKRYGDPELQVTLINASPDEARRGRCTVENLGFVEPFASQMDKARRAIPFEQTDLPFAVEAGQTTLLSFPIQSLREHRWTTNVRIRVTVDEAVPMVRDVMLLPLVAGGGWELTGGEPGEAHEGTHSLRLGPTSEGYQYRLPTVWVEPLHRYRYTVFQKRSGFEAAVRGIRTTIRDNRGDENYEYKHADATRPNQWQELTGEFTTPHDVTRAGLYLYNVRSSHTAWFDSFTVEDLGPVAPSPGRN